jgi:Tfp pilus assembly protein PilF
MTTTITSDELNQRGMELVTQGQLSPAIEIFEQAHVADPEHADLLGNLGLSYLLRNAAGDVDAAIECFEQALLRKPDEPVVHSYLGGAYSLRLEDERAIAHLERSLTEPSVFALRQLSLILARNGRFAETLARCNQLLAMHPDDEPARANRAMMLLATEQFEQGWPDFEYRNYMPEERARTERLLKAVRGIRQWRGEDISDKHLLLYAEGGMGDSLQFWRFIPEYLSRCARLSIYDRAESHRLLEKSFGAERVTICAQPPLDADYYILMMSAGTLLKLDHSNVARPPYLRAPDDPRWQRLMSAVPRPRVGIVWAGQASNVVDGRRSLRLDQVRPLFEVPVGWTSLQLDLAGEECPIFNPMTQVTDWLDTAAIVAQLDLVIAVDTAVAHLAAGLGKPVWLLNRFDTCWRWGLSANSTPWYPNMRIFRQPTLGEWRPVIAEVCRALRTWAAETS